jgi:outer membrane lipoprotein SlyB
MYFINVYPFVEREKNMKIISILSVSLLAITFCGCSEIGLSKQTQGTILGGATGALVGSQIGGGTGSIVAAGVGAVGGALVGSEIGKSMDQKDHRHVETTSYNRK